MRETRKLSELRTDGGTQARAGLDPAKVEEYHEALAAGDDFPALVAFYDGTDYWLADGFHRLAAAKLAGIDRFLVDVKQGTRRDAILYAVGANATHGLPRTADDKRRAVETLLRDEEWGKWSDREIARRCKVSPTYVGKIRAELTVHVDSEPVQERTYVTRHGTQATMDTSRIGDPGPLKRAIEANVDPAAYEDIHSLQRCVTLWSRDHFPVQMETAAVLPFQIQKLDAMKHDHKHSGWSDLTTYLVRQGKVFRVNDLRQAVNNALDGLRQSSAETQPASNQPSEPAQENELLQSALPLADYVEGFVMVYKDPFGRDVLQIPNPSHTNGTFWQAIKSSFERDGVRYKNDAELKIAIKRVFAKLKNEPEPNLKYWEQFAEGEDEEQPTADFAGDYAPETEPAPAPKPRIPGYVMGHFNTANEALKRILTAIPKSQEQDVIDFMTMVHMLEQWEQRIGQEYELA